MSCKISLVMVVFSFLFYVFTITDAYLPPRPTRPEKFANERELKDYLVKLKEFYAISARGRYGKRSPEYVQRPYFIAPLPYYFPKYYGSYLDFPLQQE